MAEQWFYQVMGEEFGPCSGAELKERAVRGDIRRDTLVRRGTYLKWVSAWQVEGLFKTPPQQTAASAEAMPPVLAQAVSRSAIQAVPREAHVGLGGWGIAGLGFLLLLLIGVLAPSGDDTRHADKDTRHAENVPVVFDVPSLFGKSIDEVRGVLGAPEESNPEPSQLQLQMGFDEWSNVFARNGQELFVHFDTRSRLVTYVFLPGNNETTLMQRANLTIGSTAYRIVPVKAIRNPSMITGIKVIP